MLLLCRWHSELSRWWKKSHRMFFSLLPPPTYIYESMCVHKAAKCPEEILLWKPFESLSFEQYLTAHFYNRKDPARAGYQRGSRAAPVCSWVMSLDRRLCSFFFPCQAQSFILILDPQGGDSSSLWLLILETACTMLVLLAPASVSQEALETLLHSIFCISQSWA